MQSATRELEGFLARGDESFVSERTFIHFNDLVVWLRDLGYIDRSDPDQLGPAFRAFESIGIKNSPTPIVTYSIGGPNQAAWSGQHEICYAKVRVTSVATSLNLPNR